MRYRVRHTTTYRAQEPVSVCHDAAWLTPRSTPSQQCEFHQLTFDPRPSITSRRIDVFGNEVTYFSFNEGYHELQVTSVSRVSAIEVHPLDPAASPNWDQVRHQLEAHQAPADIDALQFVFASPRIPRAEELADYARGSFSAGRPILAAAVDLTSRVYEQFEYDPRATTVTTPVPDVLRLRKGVCQDFAHLQIAMLRSLGLAARYVSGYVRTDPPPGERRLVGADASHAWLSVYCGERGWIDIDPTNNKLTGDEHITVAWGRDYSDVCPIKGVYVGGGGHSLTVSVDVASMTQPTPANQ